MSEPAESFGVIVACYRRDYPLALGCLASVRTSMPGVPLALIVDGEFPMPRLERLGPVRIIRRADVKDAFLRDRSFGWGLTKMLAFWESPWPRFLFLDADTVLRGDLRMLDDPAADVVVDRPPQVYTDQDIATYFFETKRLGELFPGFAWRGRGFVNTGAFFARRGAIDLAEYRGLYALMQAEKGLFQCGEQGLLNFLLFRAADEKRLRLTQAPLQTLVPDHPVEALRRRFLDDGAATGPAQVIHWCGAKPWLVKGAEFREPMTSARRQTASIVQLWCHDAAKALRETRTWNGVMRRLRRSR